MTTGERMKERRKALGISAEYIAEKLQVSPATIYRYEKGDIEKMPGNVLEPISEILFTTPAYLMGWAEEPTPASALVLSDDEDHLIKDYRSLNEEGKTAVRAAVSGFVSMEIYKKRDDSTVTLGA